MNSDDEYRAWLDTKRGESPPTELTDRIMLAVREVVPEATTSPRMESARKTAWQRAVPYLVCSVAMLVLAVRLYSFVSVFVVAPFEADIVMTEPVGEFFDVNKP